MNFQCKTIAKISFFRERKCIRTRNFFKQSFKLRGLDLFFYTYVIGTNKYIYIYMYVCARVYVCVYVCMYECIFTYVHENIVNRST